MVFGVTLLTLTFPVAGIAQQPAVPERVVETRHAVRTASGTLNYGVHTGHLPLVDPVTGHRADVFFVYYALEGGADRRSRPISFAFNGGPGQPAVWLHLGLGPMRAPVEEPSMDTRFAPGNPSPPPYRPLEPNESTWLTETDLVFVDPVSTGYSRPAPGQAASQFHGYTQDVEYLGEFIRLFLGRFDRWGSPKFLIGESYGTTRVAGLSRHLQSRHGVYLNGLILVSGMLNWQTGRFHIGNDLPYLLFLPTYTATAWYHGQLRGALAEDLADAVRAAKEFALGDYALALLQGDNLPVDEQRRVAERLAELTGLTPEYVERSNLRIDGGRFTKELRRHDRVTVGRLDSRYIGVDRDAAGEQYEYDPSYYIYGPYSTLLNEYLRDALRFRSDLPYEVRAGDLVRPWDYGSATNRYLNVAEDLRYAMAENPYLKLFVASGLYDLATPFFAMDYTLSQMGLDRSQRLNVDVAYYESGHMMYIHPPSLEKLKDDVSRFYRSALGDR